MSRYRKIDPRTWNDEKFRPLKLLDKLVFYYCLTAQSNRIGLFKFSPALASEDLDVSAETFRKSFENVKKAFSWVWDEDHRVLYIPTWWKYNKPENANTLIACLSDLEALPNSLLVSRFFSNCQYLSGTLLTTFEEFTKNFGGAAKTHTAPVTDPDPALSGSESEDSQSPKRGRKRPLPTDFALTDARREVAERFHLDPERTFEGFRSYWLGEGGVKVDWDQTWLNWCSREKPTPTRPSPEGPNLNPGNANIARFINRVNERDGNRSSENLGNGQRQLVSPAGGRPDDRGVGRDAERS